MNASVNGSLPNAEGHPRKLRVVMISEYPYTEQEQGLGGIMQATFQLVEGFRGLADPGLDLHIVSESSQCRSIEMRASGGITFHYLPKQTSEIGIMLGNTLRLASYLRRLRNTLQPDLFHGQGSVRYLLLSLWSGRPSVQTIHGIYRNELATISQDQLSPLRRLRHWLKVAVEKYYLRRIRNLIAITKQITTYIAESGNSNVRIRHINNCIDEAFFSFAQPAQTAVREILFVAAITPRKGLEFLIGAFRRLAATDPALRLSVAGTWDWAPDYVAQQREACADLIARGQVVFTGPLSRGDLVAAFGRANLFVLPSLAESAPMVISQAMCMGLPVISTLVGGIPEMISQDDTGLLVPPADEVALEQAIRRMISDPELRARLGRNARSAALERYHPLSIARATRDFYDEIIQIQE
jgi:glycosyltransferase involved in cell wall biosynthesis